MVKLFNIWYFLFILIGAGTVVGLYFLLRNKTDKTKKIVLGCLLGFNLALHFLKMLFPPYSTNMDHALKNVFFVNICATSVLFFPFIFLSKSKTAKDYMFYLGVISGALALLYPTEAINKSLLTLDLWRFYYTHIVIFAVPLLMVLLKLHQPNFKRIWKIPFCIMAMLLFIVCNQILQSELGIITLRGDDIANIPFHNPSLIWGPTDDVAVMFSWLTPNFMKTVPYGEFAGTEKYWPFFWILPSIFFYFTILPFLLCLIFDFKNIKQTTILIFGKIKNLFAKKQTSKKAEAENSENQQN